MLQNLALALRQLLGSESRQHRCALPCGWCTDHDHAEQPVTAFMSTNQGLSKDLADFCCRSPVYATFSEALDGAVTIRAFGAQKLFVDLNEQQVAALQQASFAGEIDKIF